MKDELEREAREWLEANTKIRWATAPEHGVTPDELNRRPDKYASWLAAFARQQLEARDRQNERYRAALEHYADETRWKVAMLAPGQWTIAKLKFNDGGNGYDVARTALND